MQERNEEREREFETAIRTKAGEKKIISWYSRNLVEGNGNCTGSVVLGQDITERKRAEETLREMNQHLQALIKAAPLAIISQDYRGNVTEWNPAAEQIFGWREEEVLGKPTPIIPEDKKEEFRNIFENVLKGNTVSGLETYRQSKDGVVIDVSLSSATLYGSDGKPRGNVTLLEDITERRNTEEEKRRLIEQLRTGRERLRELSRRIVELQETERREIARELHDEVGQTLTALSINLNIIENLVPKEVLAKLKDRIDDSQKLVEETMMRVRDVMARLRPPVLDDYGLVAALNWYNGQFMKRNGIPAALILKGEEVAPRLPLGTEIAMFRIAQEALNNVVKHAKASQVTLILENRGDSVRMVIDDNGGGFDPEALRRNGAQPGWGLINMRERAESVGGQLEIESTPGKGTKVIVEVPRNNRYGC